MATLNNLNSLSAGATAHLDVNPVEQPKPIAPAVVAEPQAPGVEHTAGAAATQVQAPSGVSAVDSSSLPGEGLVIAEANEVYRTVDRKFLSHTSGLVVKEPVVLKLVPGGQYKLICSPADGHKEEYLLDPADWELRPASLDEIVPTVHTLKAKQDTTKQVLLAGEFEGEDLPLYDIEIKYRGGLRNAILHPNEPGAAHKLEEGQSKLVRLGFEQQVEAQEWHALLNICMGGLDLDNPCLASLPKALAASNKMRSFRAN